MRREHVIKGGEATVSYYCGACNRSWNLTEERQGTTAPDESRRRRRDDKPPRS
jgi:hypothetical protein